MEEKEQAENPQLLQNDIETFGTLCKEMNETLEESQEKLETLKEKLTKMNETNPPNNSGSNTFQYIDVKSMLLLNYVTSLQYFTLCKAEGKDMQEHEIFERLSYLRLIIEKLKPLDKKVDYQIEKLLKSALTQSQGESVLPNRKQKEDNLKYRPNLNNFDSKHITEKADQNMVTMEGEGEAEGEDSIEDLSDGSGDEKKANPDSSDIDPDNINSDDIDSDALERFAVKKQKAQAKNKSGEHINEEEIYKAVTNNPMKMVDTSRKAQKQREKDQNRMKRVDLVRELKHDMLDLPEEVNYGIASGNRRLIEQEKEDEDLEMKYFKRISYTVKEQKQREKKIKRLQKSDYSGITDGFHDFQRIQEFMGKTYGGDEDEEMQKHMEKEKFLQEVRSRKRDKKSKVKFLDEEINSDEAGDDVLFQKLPNRGNKSGTGDNKPKKGNKKRFKRRKN
ncbi:unnamed protein product [Moneuplotes crassus]|uniref:Neuroguidin n=1 Tax=Euplotes crassus TaxID=5936 RepID=A0AAD1UHU1_EUPCR|nr:unnamed protein product [Moneuplotes crassus]